MFTTRPPLIELWSSPTVFGTYAGRVPWEVVGSDAFLMALSLAMSDRLRSVSALEALDVFVIVDRRCSLRGLLLVEKTPGVVVGLVELLRWRQVELRLAKGSGRPHR